jgi:hypothetical protein
VSITNPAVSIPNSPIVSVDRGVSDSEEGWDPAAQDVSIGYDSSGSNMSVDSGYHAGYHGELLPLYSVGCEDSLDVPVYSSCIKGYCACKFTINNQAVDLKPLIINVLCSSLVELLITSLAIMPSPP